MASSSRSAKYQVFLSFRGEDTRDGFLGHLYRALEQQGIITYIDNEKLEQGESIGPALMKAISESEIAIIVFSENYADSAWCLNELVYIMKCRNKGTLIVQPIFYKVDPSELRNQKGKYGEALAQHELKLKNKFKTWRRAILGDHFWYFATQEQKAFAKQELENKTKVESWKKALEDAGNIAGWDSNDIANRHESTFIKTIVKIISRKLHPVTSSLNNNLVGIESPMKDLKSKLQIGSGGVRMIGLWGVGGCGKTILAHSIYDEISWEFECCCFVKNIRAESKSGLRELEKHFLSQMGVHKVRGGSFMINNRFRETTVLIILDDVDHQSQLDVLAGSHDWFGPGSRIIITTRDEQILDAHRVDSKKKISLLNDDDAITLFCNHSPRYNIPIEEYGQLSKEVVSYAGGLPLALTVLGRFLSNKNATEWRSELDKLKEFPNPDILDTLKISYEGLDQLQKQLFLDIACFFRRVNQHKAMERLDACGFHPHTGVRALIQKALITISDGKFDMHNLVRDMAHHIVRGEHPNNPAKHTRVWKKEDVQQICSMEETTKLDMIEAIRCRYNKPLQCLPPIVANMEKVRWIDWRGDLASPLPTNFPPRTLCCLTVEGILQEQLWEGDKQLQNLKMMELNGFRNLTMTPNFRGLTKLTRFKLTKCSYLEEVHDSIGCLESLVFLSIEHCCSLKMFPPITRLKKLETLTFSQCPKLFKLSEIQQQNMNHIGLRFSHRRLKKLVLSGCDLGDEHMGSAVWELPYLQKLDLTENNFERLDFSLLQLPRLKWLNISKCQRLLVLKLPSSIAVVIADDCTSLDTFKDISNCKWLWNFSHLKGNKLGSDMLLHSMLEGNAVEDHYISVALEHQNPEEFVGGLFRVKTFTLHLPPDWYKMFSGFLIYIVTDIEYPNVNIIIKKAADDYPGLDLDVEPELEYDETRTSVGYVAFNKLGGTALLTSSYNIITFSIEDRFSGSNAGESYVGATLISRKTSDQVQATTDCSEFWDEERQHGNAFTIQHDSESSIKIQWFPFVS